MYKSNQEEKNLILNVKERRRNEKDEAECSNLWNPAVGSRGTMSFLKVLEEWYIQPRSSTPIKLGNLHH